MAKTAASPSIEPVPESEGQPVYQAAVDAKQRGARIFTCAVIVAYTEGGGLGLGAKRTTTLKRWDPSALLDAIEALGWRLEHLDHVWAQTAANASIGNNAIVKGLTHAHYLFRAL
ncbi:hypothetical protein [Georgenia ruanii]|uniref:hypothetical protein n=1 Tax=Georgenia ruanii TaxID=348442 RepID=UPI0012652E52|nr:hypothetical protein [Georgenia ruanii]